MATGSFHVGSAVRGACAAIVQILSFWEGSRAFGERLGKPVGCEGWVRKRKADLWAVQMNLSKAAQAGPALVTKPQLPSFHRLSKCGETCRFPSGTVSVLFQPDLIFTKCDNQNKGINFPYHPFPFLGQILVLMGVSRGLNPMLLRKDFCSC